MRSVTRRAQSVAVKIGKLADDPTVQIIASMFPYGATTIHIIKAISAAKNNDPKEVTKQLTLAATKAGITTVSGPAGSIIDTVAAIASALIQKYNKK